MKVYTDARGVRTYHVGNNPPESAEDISTEEYIRQIKIAQKEDKTDIISLWQFIKKLWR